VIIVDTSVWIDHLHSGEPAMATLLGENLVLMHPFVLGELALGSLRNWQTMMRDLSKVPQATRAHDSEVINLIANHKLQGTGIGFIDAHLLASALLSGRAYIWTRDRRLAAVAERLGLDAETA
jgi:predicted nucleic acid-binding protein